MSSFNIFRLSGDFLHLASFFILLLKIYTLKNCKGISLKTQCLYVLVFLTRYPDVFWNFHSLYNTSMKLIFITLSVAIVYLMAFKKPYCNSYEKSTDTFFVGFLIIPCLILACVFNEFFSFAEIMYTFSIYLESVAIIPQLVVVHEYAKRQNGFVENLTSHYVFTLGGYRAMYLVNWIYRYYTEDVYSHWIVWIAGFLQTAIYCDFFFYYIKARMKGESVSLPI